MTKINADVEDIICGKKYNQTVICRPFTLRSLFLILFAWAAASQFGALVPNKMSIGAASPKEGQFISMIIDQWWIDNFGAGGYDLGGGFRNSFLEVVTLFSPLPYEVRWKPLQSKIRPLQDIIILNLNT